MVYLVNNNGKIRVFYSEEKMKEAGFKKADLTVTEEKFNSNGCYARLIDEKILVGRTEAEIAEQENQEKIDEYMAQLKQIDLDSGAGRAVRAMVTEMNEVMSQLKQITIDITDTLRIQNPNLEVFDPNKNKVLKSIIEYNLETAELQIITDLEQEAEIVREQLRPLLNPIK